MDTEQKRHRFDELALQRDHWRRRNRYYYQTLEAEIGRVVPPGQSILEIGCATGHLLAALSPARGLGIDISAEAVRLARAGHGTQTTLEFRQGNVEQLKLDETFDYIILSDVIGELDDVWAAVRCLRTLCTPRTRLIVTYFNHLWEPLLRLGEKVGLKMPQPWQNWLSPRDIKGLLELADFAVVTTEYRQLLPKRIPLISSMFNRVTASLPGIRKLGLSVQVVARPVRLQALQKPPPSVSVIIPCRNERGNIRAAIERLPSMGSHVEAIFVDGNSNDGTVEEIEAVIADFPDRDIKLIHQLEPGSADGVGHGRMLRRGKGDAVHKGFHQATGDVVMILDSDLTVPPEDLPKFYLALVEGHGEFVAGNRLVYPMERQAMRFLNKLANKAFGVIFSWLLGQHIKDTLCGTKVMYRRDYLQMTRQTREFGDDPFGDFDLLLGASKLKLAIVEIPVRYRDRSYGEVKIQRFRHGLMLLKMTMRAARLLKR